MPTTRLKNDVYRLMLPFFSPGAGKEPITDVYGHPLNQLPAYRHLIRKHHVLGSAALIASGQHESVILSKSDDPCHIAAEDTYFRVASITKMATAAVAMMLVDKKLISLDDEITAYLPLSVIPDELKGVTLRHLLSHMSGLKDPIDLEQKLENSVPLSEAVRNARVSIPGKNFLYSNLGFGLIGCMLESVMNLPVDRIFEMELFKPLNMNSTLSGCSLPCERIMPVTRVLPYRKGQDLILTKLGRNPLNRCDPLRHYGHTAGSMYTDIRSLKSLLRLLIDNTGGLLSDGSLSEMKKVHAFYGSASPTLSYGLGLLRINDPRVSHSPVWGHQGFAYGCADCAFWEENTSRIMIFLNGGCSEARSGRLGTANREFSAWAFRKELPDW